MRYIVRQMTGGPVRDDKTVWDIWLLVLAAVLGIGGLVLAVAPGPARSAFGLFAYGDPSALDALGAETVHYLTLVHAVLASALVGWSIALITILRGPFLYRERRAWVGVLVSVVFWYVIDMGYSVYSDAWLNAAANTVLLVLFVIPLGAVFPRFRSRAEQAHQADAHKVEST